MDFYNLILGKKSNVDDGKKVTRELDTKDEKKIKKDIDTLVKKRNKKLKLKGYEKMYDVLKPEENKNQPVVNNVDNGNGNNNDVDENEEKQILDRQINEEDSIYQNIIDQNLGPQQLNEKLFQSKLNNIDDLIHRYKQHDTNYNRKKIKEYTGKRIKLLNQKQKLDNKEDLRSSYYHEVVKRNKKYKSKYVPQPKPEVIKAPENQQQQQAEIKLPPQIPIKKPEDSKLNQGQRLLKNINNNQGVTTKNNKRSLSNNNNKDVNNNVRGRSMNKSPKNEKSTNDKLIELQQLKIDKKKPMSIQGHDIIANKINKLEKELNQQISPVRKASPVVFETIQDKQEEEKVNDKLIKITKLIEENKQTITHQQHVEKEKQIKVLKNELKKINSKESKERNENDNEESIEEEEDDESFYKNQIKEYQNNIKTINEELLSKKLNNRKNGKNLTEKELEERRLKMELQKTLLKGIQKDYSEFKFKK